MNFFNFLTILVLAAQFLILMWMLKKIFKIDNKIKEIKLDSAMIDLNKISPDPKPYSFKRRPVVNSEKKISQREKLESENTDRGIEWNT